MDIPILPNIQKCLSAGFPQIFVVTPKQRSRLRIEKAVRIGITPELRQQLVICTPAEVFDLVEKLDQARERESSSVRGYRVKVRVRGGDPQDVTVRRAAVSAFIAGAVKTLGRKGKPS